MAQILVANPTHQHYDFQYRIPGHAKIFSADVKAGRQVRLPVDMDETQLAAVVRQLERYGAVPKNDVESLISPRALVYSIDRPIPSDTIDEAREKDEAIRQGIADEQVEAAGVATPAVNGEVGAHLKQASLEVRELAPTQQEQPVKGGVDTKIVVSKEAGARQKTTG